MMPVDQIRVPGTAAHRIMLKLAVAYARQLDARRRTYEEECRRDAARGYRPHYCIHGTNQWTDYDNICGACEDGCTDRELALGWAMDDTRNWIERMSAVTTFSDAAKNLGHRPQELSTLMGEWACEPLDILNRHPRPVRNLP